MAQKLLLSDAMRCFNRFTFSLTALTVLVLLTYTALQWLEVPTGRFFDWLIGVASAWWLLVIVTLPWDMHFRAKEVLADAARSTDRGISVTEGQLKFVRAWARSSLTTAIALHVLSGVGLYVLAVVGISSVGYFGSGAAILLTALRPAIRAYEYFIHRLEAIRRGIKYPHDDVVELRQKIQETKSELEKTTKEVELLQARLDTKDPSSWASLQQSSARETHEELGRLRATIADLRETNQTDHARLSRETQHAVAQITEDGQFLDHVREVIRFFKTA